ncbi:MAG: metal ABC transporter permease [Planctomycetes bacterium]|nr:metal ABC transporter permease [Planctomycetota bacterium]
MDLLSFLDQPGARLFARALLVCAFLGVSGGLLGCVLVVRRMTLMADALAHSLLPGVALAWLLFGANLAAMLAGGLLAGLATALGSGLISRLTRLKEDTAFAGLFAGLFACGLLIASRAGSPGDLQHLLFGQVLAVGPADLWLAAGVSVATVATFALFYRNILLECFDPQFHRAGGGWGMAVHFGLLALTVVGLVASLHVLGVVLALGLFTLPAATAYLWCDRWGSMLLFSMTDAVAGCVLGFALSWWAGLPSGACMVATLGVMFVASALISPHHGLLARLRRPHRHQREDTDAECPRH